MSEPCQRQSQILRAATEDRWTDALRDHLAECGDCAAAASVAPWMQSFSQISDREHILPNPTLVWLKAQLLQGHADATRLTRPLNIMQLGAYFLVAGGWAALLTWRWAAVEAWLRGFTPAGLVATAAASESLSISFFATLIALASITIMLTLHTILAEE